MLRRNRRPLLFTGWELQQLERTTVGLRQSNRAALRALQRVRRFGLSTTRYSKEGDSLQMITAQMISALRLRQEILRAGSDREPQTISIKVVYERYDMCSQSRQRRKPDDDEPASGEAPKQDPAYQAEIDSLLELAQRTAERVSRCCKVRAVPTRTFFAGINRLTSALLRQQRHLRETAFKRVPRIDVIYPRESSDLGAQCHRPAEEEASERIASELDPRNCPPNQCEMWRTHE